LSHQFPAAEVVVVAADVDVFVVVVVGINVVVDVVVDLMVEVEVDFEGLQDNNTSEIIIRQLTIIQIAPLFIKTPFYIFHFKLYYNE